MRAARPSRSSDAPLVSIVIPVRDGARFLDEAVASALAQTHRDLELVVVDDGSTDATPHLLRDWQRRDPRVQIVTRSRPGGIARALIDGVNRSTGSLLARLDADDRAAQERLHLQVEQFCGRPHLGLLGTGVRYMDADGRIFGSDRGISGSAAARDLQSANPFFHPSVMLRRSAYDAAGGYRPQAEAAEDLDLWLRIAERFEVDNLEEPLTDYRLHAGQSTLRDPSRQAVAAVAAHWAADLRATGATDPLDDVDRLDEACHRSQGIPTNVIARELVRSHGYAAELSEQAGYQDLARTAWARARSIAASLGSAEEAQLLLRRARFRCQQGRLMASGFDGLRAFRLAPRRATEQFFSGRRRVPG